MSALTATLTRSWRLADYWVIAYRATWTGSVLRSFFNPLLYIVSLGVMLGSYVHGTGALGGATYLQFVTAGMLAGQAMNTAVSEVTYPVMTRILWDKSYSSMLATPLGVAEVVIGQIVFVVARVGLVIAVFMLVLAPFGVYTSWWSIPLIFLVLLLVALAFATPLYALSSSVSSDAYFALVFRLVIFPIYMFSGSFFPISSLPRVLRWIAEALPLWHGVDLTRMLVLSHVDVSMALIHCAYLLVLSAVGWWATVVLLKRRLIA